MRIRIHRSYALTLISVLWLFAFAAAQTNVPGQPFNQFSHSSQLRGKTGKTRKANAANTPVHYTYEVLYNFCSVANCADGSQVAGSLIRDAAGNLYGVTPSGGDYLGGTVFELDTTGNEIVLYSFCSKPGCTDGIGPNGLVMDSAGNLYGTAIGGGANESTDPQSDGVVFELAPPTQPGGAWTEAVLYNFCSAKRCSDGYGPTGIIQDAAGNLYGTTSGGDGYGVEDSAGTVFELSPPSQPGGTWIETVLHVFCSSSPVPCEDGMIPNGGLIQDAAGNLYGTTMHGPCYSAQSCNANGNPVMLGTPGTVFKVAPPSQPGGAWTETVLYYFCSLVNCADGENPSAGLIKDTAGNLYGTTYSGVFELAPPAQPSGTWSLTVLHNFCSLADCADGAQPEYSGVIMDAAGNLFGTTLGGGINQNAPPDSDLSGTAFELSPPAQPGGAWTETVLYSFCSAGGWNCTDGDQPRAGLLRDPAGNLYGGTWAGGSHGGGTVYTLAVPSFTVAGTSVSLDPGATTDNTSTITLNPRGGFTGKVTLAAAVTSNTGGAQDLPTLSFGSSNTVSITSASAVTATLTITTTAPSNAALERSARPGVRWHTGGMTLALGLIFGIGICIPVSGRTRRTRLGSLLFLVILASGLLSCGGGNSGNSNPGTTPGVYVVTVTGTSGSITATSTVILTVQ